MSLYIPLKREDLQSRLNLIAAGTAEAQLRQWMNDLPPPPKTLQDAYGDSSQIANILCRQLRETLLDQSTEEQGLGLYWGLRLLGDTGDLPQDDPQIVKRVYVAFIQRACKPFLSGKHFDPATLCWIAHALDHWRRSCKKATGYALPGAQTLRIVIPEPNPYQTSTAYRHLSTLLDAWTQGHLRPIRWLALTPEESYGGFIFCVTVFSGLTNARRRKQVLEGLRACTLDTHYSSLTLPRDPRYAVHKIYGKKPPGVPIYRWIADPMSARIYHRFYKDWHGLRSGTQWNNQYLQKFLGVIRRDIQTKYQAQRLDIQGGTVESIIMALNHFASMKPFIEAAQIFQENTLPSYLWHYMEGKYETRDLYPETLQRLSILSRGDILARTHNAADLDPVATSEVGPTPANLFESINQVVTLVKTHTPENQKCCTGAIFESAFEKQLSDRLTELELPTESFIHQAAGWIVWLMKRDDVEQDQKPDWIDALLRALFTHFDLNVTLNDLDNEEREEEFETILTDSELTAEEKSRLTAAWVSFHAYLIDQRQIAPAQAVFVSTNQPPRVDAEYLSEFEFWQASRSIMRDQDRDPFERDVALLVMTLSYRLGLRRSEITKIATSHVSLLDGQLDVLSVTPWAHRRLKTPSSRRTLPIRGILKPEEENWLRRWVLARTKNRRLDQSVTVINDNMITYYERRPDRTDESFLFLSDQCLNNSAAREAESRKIIGYIHDVLRKTTRQDKFRFHHLRHSCATNMLLLLNYAHLPKSLNLMSDLMYGRDIKELANNVPHERRMDDLAERAYSLRQTLFYGTTASVSEVYAVSRLLGHSSPNTTLSTYIHAIDLLLGAHLHERFMSLPKRLVHALHPESKTAIKKRGQAALNLDNNHTALKQASVGYPKGRKRKAASTGPQ